MQNLSNTDCGVFQMINHISNDSDCGVFAIAFATSLVLLFTHDIFGSVDPGGSKYPTILYSRCINTDANLLVCLPESWSHYSFSDG